MQRYRCVQSSVTTPKKVPTKVQGKRLGSEKVKKTRDRNRKKRYREQRYYNLRCPKSGTQQKRKAEQ